MPTMWGRNPGSWRRRGVMINLERLGAILQQNFGKAFLPAGFVKIRASKTRLVITIGPRDLVLDKELTFCGSGSDVGDANCWDIKYTGRCLKGLPPCWDTDRPQDQWCDNCKIRMGVSL